MNINRIGRNEVEAIIKQNLDNLKDIVEKNLYNIDNENSDEEFSANDSVELNEPETKERQITNPEDLTKHFMPSDLIYKGMVYMTEDDKGRTIVEVRDPDTDEVISGYIHDSEETIDGKEQDIVWKFNFNNGEAISGNKNNVIPSDFTNADEQNFNLISDTLAYSGTTWYSITGKENPNSLSENNLPLTDDDLPFQNL